jgi:hypothetical protein
MPLLKDEYYKGYKIRFKQHKTGQISGILMTQGGKYEGETWVYPSKKIAFLSAKKTIDDMIKRHGRDPNANYTKGNGNADAFERWEDEMEEEQRKTERYLSP